MNRKSFIGQLLLRLLSIATITLLFSHNTFAWVPTVDLGNDTVVCAPSLTLDAGNPGATYLWSTSATSQMITVTTSDTFWVQVTDGSGTSSDTIVVEILDASTVPNVSDIDQCGPGIVNLTTTSVFDDIFWYDVQTGGTPVATGNPASVQVNSSTTYYAEGVNYASIYTASETAGFDTVMGGQYFTIPTNRGLIFNAKTEFILKSVVFYSTPSPLFSGNVVLRNNNNTLLASKSFTSTVSGGKLINLNFHVPEGNNYKLMLENFSGGTVQTDNTSPTFPISSPYVDVLDGTPNSGRYNFFYDWQLVGKETCVSQRSELTITTLPAPDFDFGNDTAFCGTSLTLDVTTPGATYNWSTGDSTPVITVTNKGQVQVQVTLGSCIKSDTLQYDILSTATDPIINDTSICGSGDVEFTLQGVNDNFYWFDSPTATTPITLGNNVTLAAPNSTTYYVESRNVADIFTVPSNAGLDTIIGGVYANITNSRGMVFNAKEPCIIHSVTVYLEPQPIYSGEIVLYDPNGTQIGSKMFSSAQSGPTTVILDFLVPMGEGNRLMLENPSGGKIQLNNANPPLPVFSDAIDIMDSYVPYQNRYFYFYDWKLKLNQFCASNRIPVNIDVALPFILPENVYTCDTVTLSAGNNPGVYQWNTGSTDPSILVDSSGLYILTASDGMGCTVIDSSEVLIPTVGLPDNGILCGNLLETNFDSTSTFLWSNGDTTSTLMVTAPGTYSVFIQEPLGCSLRDTIVITGFDQFPEVDLGADQSTCVSTDLNAGNPGLGYEWSTGDTSQIITVTSSGTYWVAVFNSNGCTTYDTIGVDITPIPEALFTPVVNGYSVTFVNQSDFGSWSWDFGDGESSNLSNPVHTYADTGTFSVQLIVSNSCGSDTFTQNVQISPSTSIDDNLLDQLISIYPNPANDFVKIDFKNGLAGFSEIELIDTKGRVHYSAQQMLVPGQSAQKEINLANFAKGLYLVRIKLENKMFTSRVLIL